MKYILFALLLLTNIKFSHSSEIVWGPILKYKTTTKYSTLLVFEDHLYELQSTLSSSYIRKINLRDLTTVDSAFIELEWNEEEHEIIKGFVFAEKPWIFSLTKNIQSGITSTWVHSFNISDLSLSVPVKIADYNTPVMQPTSTFDPDKEATNIFSTNLIRLQTSLLGEYCMVISCKDMVGNVARESKEEQQERILETQFFNNSFDNKITSLYKPPSDNFFIYDIEIDLDGSVYFLGRTYEVDFSKTRLSGEQNIYAYNNLQIIKYDPQTGNYIIETIEDENEYFSEFNLIVDVDIYFVGQNQDMVKNTSKLVYKQFDSNLIKKSSQTMDQPMLGYESIFFNKLNNGDLLLLMEKRTLVFENNMYSLIYGDLLLFCFNGEEKRWTKVIAKNQKGTDSKYLGAFAHLDGENLHVYFNESDIKTENDDQHNVSVDASKFNKIRHIIVSDDGEISKNEELFLFDKKPLLLYIATCREISPGTILFKANNKTKQVMGKFEY